MRPIIPAWIKASSFVSENDKEAAVSVSDTNTDGNSSIINGSCIEKDTETKKHPEEATVDFDATYSYNPSSSSSCYGVEDADGANEDADDSKKMTTKRGLYYKEIENELQALSTLHKMEERNSNSNGQSRSKTTVNGNKRRAGGTRKLQPRHCIDFVDDDVDDDDNEDDNNAFDDDEQQQQQQQQHQHWRQRRKLFNQFARTVCLAKCIPRKEIFETWSVALYIHYFFLSTTSTPSSSKHQHQHRQEQPLFRIADLVCSHGLLSWALLLLSSYDNNNNESDHDQKQEEPSNKRRGSQEKDVEQKKKYCDDKKNSKTSSLSLAYPTLSAVCIDLNMPKSSETIERVFREEIFLDHHHHPYNMNDNNIMPDDTTKQGQQQQQNLVCWDYVEGNIEDIVPSSSTLLMGIHACGLLSDKIIDLAISSHSSLALVPCCHSKKILTPQQHSDFDSMMTVQTTTGSGSCSTLTRSSTASSVAISYTLTDFLDYYRKQKLIKAGYHVQEIFIPKEFSPKNRIILAIPPSPLCCSESNNNNNNNNHSLSSSVQLGSSTGTNTNKETRRKTKKYAFVPPFPIPIADTIKAKTIVRSIAGRDASDERKLDAIKVTELCLSVWVTSSSFEASSSSLPSSSAVVLSTEKQQQQQHSNQRHRQDATATATDIVGGKSIAKTIHTCISVSAAVDLSLEDLQRLVDQTQQQEITEGSKDSMLSSSTTPSMEAISISKRHYIVGTTTRSGERYDARRRRRIVEKVHHKPILQQQEQQECEGGSTCNRLMYARTFRVRYCDCTTKAEAKSHHKLLKEVTIPKFFPNILIRNLYDVK